MSVGYVCAGIFDVYGCVRCIYLVCRCLRGPISTPTDHLRWARDAGEISAYPGISQLYLRCNMHWGVGWVWAECVQGYLMPVDV